MNAPTAGYSANRNSEEVNEIPNSSPVWTIAKLYHLHDNLHNDYSRECECGNIINLDLNLSEQPEYWTCNSCGSINKTFWTPSDEMKKQLGF
jgi:hypothetical protein